MYQLLTVPLSRLALDCPVILSLNISVLIKLYLLNYLSPAILSPPLSVSLHRERCLTCCLLNINAGYGSWVPFLSSLYFSMLLEFILTNMSHFNKNNKIIHLKRKIRGFPGNSVVKNPPTNTGDTGSIPNLGRSHMPWNN